MTVCGAVYVVLGERPELDRLARCGEPVAWSEEAGWLDRCSVHETQLGWVRRDPDRLAAYDHLAARYDRTRQLADAAAGQGALL